MRQCLALISAFAAVCVRTGGGGGKVDSMGFWEGSRGMCGSVLECACMHACGCVVVSVHV